MRVYLTCLHAAGQGQAEGSYEYLVFNSTLLGVAAEHGLHALTEWDDPELDECFDEVPLSAAALSALSMHCPPAIYPECPSAGCV